MHDVFRAYEAGSTHLLERLGRHHPRYAEVLVLQTRLLGNLEVARRYGDTPSRRAERAQIVDALNRLSIETLGIGFFDLTRAVSVVGVGGADLAYVDHPSAYHAPFQAPPLPAHFVPRPEVIKALKARLLDDGRPSLGVPVAIAIHGLGGIGKSTLAAALAHDPQVQDRFPDGILWATLGQRPDFLSLLSDWIQALGNYDFRPTTVAAATAHLRTLLHDKAALLVVDDAWDPDHVHPFLVGGPRCRLLITTREAVIAYVVRATLYDLEVMTSEQALALLTEKLNRPLVGEEREEALALAEAVGYLPLALDLAAAQVNDGVPWADLLDDLQAEIARLEALELPEAEEVTDETIRKRLSLLASFNLSLRRLPEARREQFAWLGVLPENARLTPAMMAMVWGKGIRAARDTLRRLKIEGLLLRGAPLPDGTPTYYLHTLLYDLARRMLVAPPEPAWEDALPGLGISLSEAYRLLIKRFGAWTQEEQWYVLPDSDHVIEVLVWSALHLPEPLRSEALREALAAAWEIDDERARTRALARLASCLAELGYPQEALAAARGIGEARWRAETLAGLAPHLPERLLEEALAAAWEIDNERARAQALTELASRLAELGRPQKALATVREIREARWRAEALAGLAPHLREQLGGRVLREALAAAREIEDERARTRALAGLASRLAELGRPQKALATVREIREARWRAEALVKLAPHLPEGLLEEALVAAREIGDVQYRAQALVEIVPHLSESLQVKTLREILRATWEIPAGSEQVEILVRTVLPLARLGYPEEALRAVQTIRDEEIRRQILANIAPYLPKRLLEESLVLFWEEESPLEKRVSRFLRQAGLDVVRVEAYTYRCGQREPCLHHKLPPTLYVRLVVEQTLDGRLVRRIWGEISRLDPPPKVLLLITEARPTDQAWAQIGTFRLEGKIVVPVEGSLIREDLDTSRARHLLRREIEQRMGKYDPYDARRPVSSAFDFFGRGRLVEELLYRIENGQPVGIFGLRKMGKSSLLRVLGERASFPVAVVNLQTMEKPPQLYRRILRYWSEWLRAHDGPEWKPPKFAFADPTGAFVEAALDLLDRLDAVGHTARLAVLLDEVEEVVPRPDGSGPDLASYLTLFRALRGLADEDGRLSLVVSGLNPAINRINAWQEERNPVFSLFQEEMLGPLLPEEAAQMMRNLGRQVGLVYAEESLQAVLALSGGHPFFARQLGSLFLQMRDFNPGEVEMQPDEVEQAAERFIYDEKTARLLVENFWRDAKDPTLWGEEQAQVNRALLLTLARADGPLPQERLLDGPDTDQRREALFRLERFHFIHQPELGVYALRYGLLRRWLRRRKLGLE